MDSRMLHMVRVSINGFSKGCCRSCREDSVYIYIYCIIYCIYKYTAYIIIGSYYNM